MSADFVGMNATALNSSTHRRQSSRVLLTQILSTPQHIYNLKIINYIQFGLSLDKKCASVIFFWSGFLVFELKNRTLEIEMK